jgi:hypothetical protein
MDGKLTWIDDRQQLAIKTSQGWREIQVELISRSLELHLHFISKANSSMISNLVLISYM